MRATWLGPAALSKETMTFVQRPCLSVGSKFFWFSSQVSGVMTEPCLEGLEFPRGSAGVLSGIGPGGRRSEREGQ